MESIQSDDKKLADYQQNHLYPWHLSLWKQVYCNNKNLDHFPHALLFSGSAGTGKKQLAFYFARALLCQSPKDNAVTGLLEPCQHHGADKLCRSCQLFSAATHPDFYHVSIPADKKVIPVDDIRALIQWSVLSNQLGGKKVIIIEPAEAMNINASNSLLKTLEEPASNTIIILLTDHKEALLPTIRSRCRIIDMPLPDNQSALKWLKDQRVSQAELLLSLSSGAPLHALDWSQGTQLEVRQVIISHLFSILNDAVDPVIVAEAFFKQGKVKPGKANRTKTEHKNLLITAYDVIYWFDSICSDLVRLSQNCTQDTIINIDLYDRLQQLSNRLYSSRLLQLSDSINKAYYEIQGQINVLLLFESLLINWMNCQK